MNILGLETSCDETAASVITSRNQRLEILSSVVSSQVRLHARYGGVVPNLAAREHLKNIGPVLDRALSEAGLGMPDIDLIAVTRGPGLIPALLIGTSFARALAYSFEKPLLGIHHIEGHIYANFIGAASSPKAAGLKQANVKFPLLALVVSGGHTQLILMKDHLRYEIIGETLDDAAGEAFDKVARMLKIGYPGGPAIAAEAAKAKGRERSSEIVLPRPMLKRKNSDFSFSGLKTAVLYEIKKHPEILKKAAMRSALCAEFQQAVIDVLVGKTISAAKTVRPRSVLLAGGVSANQELRRQLGEAVRHELKNSTFITPDPQYSIDNAAMIAAAGFFRFQRMGKKEKNALFKGWKNFEADAGLKLPNP